MLIAVILWKFSFVVIAGIVEGCDVEDKFMSVDVFFKIKSTIWPLYEIGRLWVSMNIEAASWGLSKLKKIIYPPPLFNCNFKGGKSSLISTENS